MKPAVDLSQLTVVVPTVSRPLFVLRQFEYWRTSNAQILILDGASAPISIPQALKSNNIRYVHTGTSLNHRLSSAQAYIHTKYCIWLPDDEFYLPSGLRSAIEKLESDMGLLGCSGRALYFFVDQGRFMTKRAYELEKSFPPYPLSASQRFNCDLPPNKTHKAVFTMFRTADWNAIFRRAYSVRFNYPYVYERLLNLKRSSLGRTEVIEELFLMRSMENPPITTPDLVRDSGITFVDWATNPQFSEEVSRYRQNVVEIILESGLNVAEAHALEMELFAASIEYQRSKLSRSKRSPTKQVGALVMRFSPKCLRLLAKRRLPTKFLRFTGWGGCDLDTMCSELQNQGIHFSRPEFERVRDLTLKLDRQTQQKERIFRGIGSH